MWSCDVKDNTSEAGATNVEMIFFTLLRRQKYLMKKVELMLLRRRRELMKNVFFLKVQ